MDDGLTPLSALVRLDNRDNLGFWLDHGHGVDLHGATNRGVLGLLAADV